MAHGRPFYQRFHDDFLMGTQDYDLETYGAYSRIIDHLNSRDRHLPDNDKFMAGILNCSPQRWRKLRAKLLKDKKLVLTEDGYLTNPRFERDKAKRLGNREIAKANGHAGGVLSAAMRSSPELPLEPPVRARAHGAPAKPAEKLQQNPQNFSNSFASSSELPEEKPNKIKPAPQDPPQAPRAGVRVQSPENKTQPIPPRVPAPARARGDGPPGRLDKPDLKDLYDQVCEAAGFCPVDPGAINRAMAMVETWVKAGIPFDTVVIPTIRNTIATTREPTRTLGRFRGVIAHEFARLKALEGRSDRYRPPASPVIEVDGEDPMFIAVRKALLERLDAPAYCAVFNAVRFRDLGPCQGDKRPLRVEGPDHVTDKILGSTDYGKVLRSIAYPLGFTDLWH